jgi:hypothetical protein
MGELGERGDSWRIPGELLTLSSLMLTLSSLMLTFSSRCSPLTSLSPPGHSAKRLCSDVCPRHKKSTFPLIFSTSLLDHIYCRNSSLKKTRVQAFSKILLLIDSFLLHQYQTMIRKLSVRLEMTALSIEEVAPEQRIKYFTWLFIAQLSTPIIAYVI